MIEKNYAERYRQPLVRGNLSIESRLVRQIPPLLIHGVTVGLVICSWYFFPPVTTLFWGGILVAVSYLSIGTLETRHSPIRISPLSAYFFWYSVKYGFAAIYMSGVIAEHGYIVFAGNIERTRLLITGYVITLVGSLAFHVGLQLLRPSASSDNASDRTIKHSVALEALILLWAVGLVALYRPVTFGFLGVGVAVISLGPLAALLVLATLPARGFRLSPVAYWAFLLLGTGGLLVVSLGAWYDSKQTIMLALTPLLAAAVVRRRMRKYIPPALACMVFVYLFAVAPAINRSRLLSGRATMSPMQRYLVAFKRYSPLYTGDFKTVALKRQENKFFSRVFEPTAVGFIAGLVQSSGLKYGATMSNLVYGFIPRFVWPGKPKVVRGAWFYAQSVRGGSGTSLGMFAAGELYWNFGWIGVVTGMLILGTLISGLWRMAGTDPRGKLLQMWLFVWILYGFVEIAEASSYLIGIVYAFLFFGGLMFLYTVARKTSVREDSEWKTLPRIPVSQPASSAYRGRT